MSRVFPENIHDPPLPPPSLINGNRNSDGTRGGVQKDTISEGVGGCYRGLFPGGLSETGELLINNSSVEKAVSYLLLPVILLSPVLQNKYYDLFPLINFYLRSAKCFFQKYSDQFRFLGNCPPTPPRSQHFALSKK